MGCTQSKSTTNAVVAQPPTKVMDPSSTKVMDPSSAHAAVNGSKHAVEVEPSKTDISPTHSTETAEDGGRPCEVIMVPSDSMENVMAETAATTTIEVAATAEAPYDEAEPPQVAVPSSPKSSPRRRRRRSNSSGVQSMASKGEDDTEEAAKEMPVTQELLLQPVVPKNKNPTVYDDAVKEMEVAMASPKGAAVDEKAAALATTRNASIHEDAVKELEETLTRLRSDLVEDKTDEVDAKVAPVEDAKPPMAKEEKFLMDPVEEARENVAPAATAKTIKQKVTQPRMCAKCDSSEWAPGSFKTCAKCRDVYYCNKTCQKAHFKVHKKTCCKTDASKRNLVESKNTSLNPMQAA